MTNQPKRSTFPPHIDPTKPAGNAQFDPREQTVRADMPGDRQTTEGQPRRGTAPSLAPDRSHQPERHDTDEWGLPAIPAMTRLADAPPTPETAAAAEVQPATPRLFVGLGMSLLATAAILRLRGSRTAAVLLAPLGCLALPLSPTSSRSTASA